MSATLPQWCLTLALPLERTRALIREDAQLGALGQTFGPVKIYSPQEAEQIKAAYERWAAAKKTRKR